MNTTIQKYYHDLGALSSLTPSDTTNILFQNLCKYASETDGVLEIDDDIYQINSICAQAEYEMELYYTRKIISSKDPKAELSTFLYYQNYVDLTRLEYLNARFFRDIHTALFLGGGPLPLTAIIGALEYDIHSTIIDSDPVAVGLARELIETLELRSHIEVICADARTYRDARQYDICSVASLVFHDADHESILENVSRLDFHILLARTALGYRQLLYRKIDESIVQKYFHIETIIHPKNHIINSLIFARKKHYA